MTIHALHGLLLAFLLLPLPGRAAEAVMPLPLVVAESEAFEIVGRLDADGLVLHVDRAPSNEPILAASLTVEMGGREAAARFRPERGDYLIDDAGWLQPLRAAGEHVLSFTLLAEEESDLLSGELTVAEAVAGAREQDRLVWSLAGLALLAGAVFSIWFARRRTAGGAA
jgi:hypothetical protein